MHELVASKYAEALLEEAIITGNVKECVEDFENFCKLLKDNKQLYEFLIHPEIKDDEKINLINNSLKGKTPDELIRTIILLITHDRIEDIFLVNEELKYRYFEHIGVKFAIVKTAIKLTDEEIEALRSKLEKKYSCDIEIENVVDESLIGGVYLRVGDETIDETVKGRLERIRKQLLKKDEVIV
ncbi:ATP synthase F1 subunit delta [Caloramator sp. mosi_1]|uniref:ATP synthase F1 subunit delta n=1 Tax=Caloramator sp. mosi_1 TaxID=3023090 RepID=UPI0023622058|nr:ATP synthase F1 subunit delta [Caloramator sp. mosi_1]WDC84890.1 ATP synthase F1 subunit delta [Caloramator sp. mosi_1]